MYREKKLKLKMYELKNSQFLKSALPIVSVRKKINPNSRNPNF